MPYSSERRCKAKAKTTGNRCRNAPVDGAPVCRMHGGSAPQVKRAAKLRLLDLVDPAIGRIARILVKGDDAVALRAADSILDRTGTPRRTEVDIDAARERLIERLREFTDDNDEDDPT